MEVQGRGLKSLWFVTFVIELYLLPRKYVGFNTLHWDFGQILNINETTGTRTDKLYLVVLLTQLFSEVRN